MQCWSGYAFQTVKRPPDAPNVDGDSDGGGAGGGDQGAEGRGGVTVDRAPFIACSMKRTSDEGKLGWKRNREMKETRKIRLVE